MVKKKDYQPPCTVTEYYQALQTALGLRDRKSFRKRYLKPALAAGLLEMTIPEKPNSRLQKYRPTQKGRRWQAQHGTDSLRQ